MTGRCAGCKHRKLEYAKRMHMFVETCELTEECVFEKKQMKGESKDGGFKGVRK